MSSAKILNAYFEASEEDRKEFLQVPSYFYRDSRRVLLQESMENFAINENTRRSQSINFAPV